MSGREHRRVARRGAPEPEAGAIVTDVPARLERLPWSRFHWLVVVALGVTWILDGLEVTLSGTVAPALIASPVLAFTPTQVGAANSAYLAGAVVGGVGFGWLTDRLGRKRLFSLTLALYLGATAATAFSWDFWSFAAFRFLTGAGIGGEYTAINSAIQELIPARRRGWTDLVINGSFWIGAAVGGLGAILLLDPSTVDQDLGWRLAFLIGAALGLFILYLRRFLPESPRWLVTHGHPVEAARIVSDIERRVHGWGHTPPDVPAEERHRLHMRGSTSLREVFRTLLHDHRRRTVLGLVLMTAQAFFYNAIFFSYALVLTRFYGVPAASVGWYILPFALGNVLGPVLLGHFFDSIGRRPMIAFTYAMSAALLAATGWLFAQGMLDATTQTLAWSLTFFFASAAASSAYLTVAECFPLEVRALAIAIFYALGTGLGGVVAPALLAALIDTGSRLSVFYGYLGAAGLMLAAALAAAVLGVDAERRPLESVAAPLSTRRPAG